MKIARLTPDQKLLRRRIIEVSYQNGLSHLGSNLSAVDLVYAAYAVKGRRGRFVLSNGHAGLALYVVLERRGVLEGSTVSGLSIHPDRDPALGISVSTGSLGQGLVIALGMALADRSRTVYCVASDGECAEGSVWEALRIGREQKVENLTIIINANGWAAYQPVPIEPLVRQFGGFGYRPIRVDGHDVKVLMRTLPTRSKTGPRVIFARTTAEQFPFLRGQDAHYYTMSEADYRLATTMLA